MEHRRWTNEEKRGKGKEKRVESGQKRERPGKGNRDENVCKREKEYRIAHTMRFRVTDGHTELHRLCGTLDHFSS